jgi:Xaa-Pro aminopeptidase
MTFADRFDRTRTRMAALGVDALCLSVGPELPWLTGYEAMPLERVTMLVLPADGDAVLVVPALEAPRVQERPTLFTIDPWGETADPIGSISDLLPRGAQIAMSDRTWARFVIDLGRLRPDLDIGRADQVVGPLRARKDDSEVAALRAAAGAADRVAAELQGGDLALRGRTEAEVSAELGRRLIAEGHRSVNFAIVCSGPNASSPHHDAGARVIQDGDVVLCDFGGTWPDAAGVGYCSDISRCVHVGEPTAEFAELYAVLEAAQAAAVQAATVGTSCETVDAAARDIIDAAGFGEFFIHRTGHGIGVEAHEDPYIVAGNGDRLEAGHAFSIEPGIYVPGRWGARIEDIVVAAPEGPDSLNRADHGLAVVDG